MSRSTISRWLTWVSYVFCFFGIYFASSSIQSDPAEAFKRFAMLAIFPLSFISFFRHTLFNGEIVKSASTAATFFEIEAGGANLSVALMLLLAYFCQAHLQVMCYVVSGYFVYLFVAAISHTLYLSAKSLLQFVPLLACMLYFIIKSGLLFV